MAVIGDALGRAFIHAGLSGGGGRGGGGREKEKERLRPLQRLLASLTTDIAKIYIRMCAPSTGERRSERKAWLEIITRVAWITTAVGNRTARHAGGREASDS